jgi:predicted DNA-binding transcriptional regulator YafY
VFLELLGGDVESLDDLLGGDDRVVVFAAGGEQVGEECLQDGEALGHDRAGGSFPRWVDARDRGGRGELRRRFLVSFADGAQCVGHFPPELVGLDRVRMKLEETFGQFELTQTPNPQIAEAEADLVATLTQGIRDRCLVEIEYQKEGEQTWSKRVVEPYSLERELPNWRVHTWDRSRDAERSFRLDRMRSAKLTRDSFEPRPAFDPRRLRDARPAKLLYAKGVAARWAAERGATPLKDGTAIADMPVGSPEWLIGEILSQRGEAVLLEPEEMRDTVATRARELANELGVSRLRVRA